MFLGFARCGECGYTITAERKIKPSGRQYVYYRCTKKSRTQICGQHRFLSEKNLAVQIKTAVQNLSLSDEWREKYLAKLNEWEGESRRLVRTLCAEAERRRCRSPRQARPPYRRHARRLGGAAGIQGAEERAHGGRRRICRANCPISTGRASVGSNSRETGL